MHCSGLPKNWKSFGRGVRSSERADDIGAARKANTRWIIVASIFLRDIILAWSSDTSYHTVPIVTVWNSDVQSFRLPARGDEAVLGQTLGDFRPLISDNGSTDNTEALVRESARADKRIVYHRFPQNVGIARNVQHVLMNPDTEFVAFLPTEQW